jgi:hypothetical protein
MSVGLCRNRPLAGRCANVLEPILAPAQADVSREAPEMPGTLTLAELDEAIAEVRANLRDLVEQETVRSGAQDENRVDDLIAAQEAKLARLLDEREALTG